MNNFKFYSINLFLIICFSGNLLAQKKTEVHLNNSSEVWKVLRTLKYEAKSTGIYQPFFSAEIEKLSGKKVTLEGFMVVIQHEKKPKYFMISYYPINSCFFCGAAGPETVIEVMSQKPVAFTEEPIAMTGILRLNAKDENKLFYILENATPVE